MRPTAPLWQDQQYPWGKRPHRILANDSTAWRPEVPLYGHQPSTDFTDIHCSSVFKIPYNFPANWIGQINFSFYESFIVPHFTTFPTTFLPIESSKSIEVLHFTNHLSFPFVHEIESLKPTNWTPAKPTFKESSIIIIHIIGMVWLFIVSQFLPTNWKQQAQATTQINVYF